MPEAFRLQPRVVQHHPESRSSAFRRPESHGTGCNKASNRNPCLYRARSCRCCLLADVVQVGITTRARQQALDHPTGAGTLDEAAYSASGRMRRGRLVGVRRARREFIQGSTEGVALMKALWARERVMFPGEFWQLGDGSSLPVVPTTGYLHPDDLADAVPGQAYQPFPDGYRPPQPG
jgi:hypothetical protein